MAFIVGLFVIQSIYIADWEILKVSYVGLVSLTQPIIQHLKRAYATLKVQGYAFWSHKDSEWVLYGTF